MDGKDFHVKDSHLTGGQIMDMARIPRSDGLVQIMEDGSQRQVDEDEVIKLGQKDQHFKKPPKFKRG